MLFEFFGILDIPIQYIFNKNENEIGFEFYGVLAPNLAPAVAEAIATVTNNIGNEMIFEKEKDKGFEFLGDLLSPHVLLWEMKIK